MLSKPRILSLFLKSFNKVYIVYMNTHLISSMFTQLFQMWTSVFSFPVWTMARVTIWMGALIVVVHLDGRGISVKQVIMNKCNLLSAIYCSL